MKAVKRWPTLRKAMVAGVILAGAGVVFLTALRTGEGRGRKGVVVLDADKAPTRLLAYRPLFPPCAAEPASDSTAYVLHRPTAVRVDPQGNIYVADCGNHRVMKYHSTGQFARQIGRAGQGPGELLRPLALDIDEEGYLYVVNALNSRVEIFSPQGDYVSSFHVAPSFSQAPPEAIAVGRNGEVFLNLPGRGYLITVFSRHGERLREFGELEPYGSAAERPYLNKVALACDRERGVLHVGFQRLPMYRQYTTGGQLLFSSRVEGEKTRSWKRAWERNKKIAPPRTLSFARFFADASVLPDGSLVMSLFGGNESTLYHMTPRGAIVERLLLTTEESHGFVEAVCATREGSILFADSFTEVVGVVTPRRE